MKTKLNPMLMCDFYKLSHMAQYPQGTQGVYSTWTPRQSRFENIDEVVFFGLQAFIKEYLMGLFNEDFFGADINDIVDDYKRVVSNTLGIQDPHVDHIIDLHELGYLPIKIMAIPEGTSVPVTVPQMTIENTHPEFYWLTNYLETIMSAELWHPCTTATIAKKYREIAVKYAEETCGNTEHVGFQCHGFEMRGMTGMSGLLGSGAGHLLSFDGSDTIPAYHYFEKFYNANVEKELVLASIPATEHSVQCVYGDDPEYFRAMIEDVYPNGFVSIVSDGYDYWKMLTEVVPSLKDKIMARDGKVVIRPDSGDPVKIICGDTKVYNYDDNEYIKSLEEAQNWMLEELTEEVRDDTPHGEYGAESNTGYFTYGGKTYKMTVTFDWNRYDKQYYFIDGKSVSFFDEAELTPVQKGSIEVLWEQFGGTVNELGYKVLDPHIGLIYGDSITMYRAERIMAELKKKGFASSNVVFGVGSYTYQYVTRDSFGYALKATSATVDGDEVPIFKDPKTANAGTNKKSQKGRVAVVRGSGDKIVLMDGLSATQVNNCAGNLMKPVYIDGKLFVDDSLADIRQRVRK